MGLAGRWRIVAMELWDAEAIDLVGPGFMELGRDRLGRLGFIAVEGQLDWREIARDGCPGVEFTWEGADDGDPVCGRGWAVLSGEDTLEGRIFFHLGDDSGFQAVRDRATPKTADPSDTPGAPRGGADE
jgi:hypothetical protein